MNAQSRISLDCTIGWKHMKPLFEPYFLRNMCFGIGIVLRICSREIGKNLGLSVKIFYGRMCN